MNIFNSCENCKHKMEDINIVLLKRRQEKERLKQQKQKVAHLKYEREKKKIEKEIIQNTVTTERPKHEKFYESLFKGDATIPEQESKPKVRREVPNTPLQVNLERKEVETKKELYKDNRHNFTKKKYKVTKRGQPVMKYQIQSLLSKIHKK